MVSKIYFTELADYTVWANNKVCGWLEQINGEQWQQEIVSSFSSIQATVLHIISAEHVWAQRIEKQEQTEWLASSFKGTKEEHLSLWKKSAAKLKKTVVDFDENNLAMKFDFKRINGELNTLAYYQAFAHAFNHSTYHRGQLVTMLRQVGFTNVASTDLLGFYRL
jgi:uncharacterized damage-inducible protein DinB